MIPSAFVIVDRLPLTIQGKLDRNALPPPPTQRQSSSPSEAPPVTATQKTLVQIWEELLEVSPIGIDDDFFDLGGHSMLAVRMVAQVQQRTGKTLPLSALFRKPTVEQLADLLDHSQTAENSLIVPLSVGGADDPIFCIHPAGGTVFCYRELAQYFSGQRGVFGLQARGLDGRQSPHATLQEMASDYADAIVAAVPSGPIHLVGWSLGGNIAYEVARQLRGAGRRVGMLALLDSGMLAAEDEVTEDDFLPLIAALFPGQDHESLEELRQKSPGEQLAYFINQAAKAGIVPDDETLVGPHVFDVFQANVKAVHDYEPSEYAGRVLLIRPADQIRTSALFDDQCLGWSKMVGSIELASVSGDHAHMLQQPAVSEIANHLNQYLIANKTDTTTTGIYPNLSQSSIDSDVTCLMDANQT
jgi:thioesterase domain-containing protein/acyl carrier protein